MRKLITISIFVFMWIQFPLANDDGDTEYDVTPEMAVKAFEIDCLRGHPEYREQVDFENIHYYEPVLLKTVDGKPSVYYVQAYWGSEPAPTFEELQERAAIATEMAINPMKYINKGMTSEEKNRKIEELSYIYNGKPHTANAFIGTSTCHPVMHSLGFGSSTYEAGMKNTMVPYIEKENPGFKFSRYVSLHKSDILFEFVNESGESIYTNPHEG